MRIYNHGDGDSGRAALNEIRDQYRVIVKGLGGEYGLNDRQQGALAEALAKRIADA